MSRLRVLIADSSATYRKMFTRAATELDSGAEVTCVSGSEEAIDKIRRFDYEIIVVDVEISDLCDFLDEILQEIPKAFVLVTARPSNANDILCAEALTRGAVDYMTKPIQSSYDENYSVVKNKIADIIDAMDKRSGSKGARVAPEPKKAQSSADKGRFSPEIVLIASSTGGPLALEKILPKLSKDFPVPILVVQHMLQQFTETLAQNLDQKSLLRVKVAEDGETVKAGIAYIAPGGTHMKLDAKNKVRLDLSPPINGVRPAADILFMSVAEAFAGAGVLAVILTGMGHDGERGLAKLKEKKDCFCLVQSEETCVVYGMPRAAVESGYADKTLDLDKIPLEIESFNYARKRVE